MIETLLNPVILGKFMLKRLFMQLLLFFAILFISNCTAANYWNLYNPTSNTNPTPEYNNPNYLLMKGGYFFHLNKIPGGIGSNVESKFSGKTCSHSILYLVSFGDSSLEAAMKEGKLQTIASVSYEQFAIFSFMYHRFCTTVTGE